MAAKTSAAKNKSSGSGKAKAAKSTKAVKKIKVATGTETDLVRRVTWSRLAKKKALPAFSTGDSIGVYVKVKEGEKERVQLFAGVVIKIQGHGISQTFTVRKIASGVGVERTFPMQSPVIDRIEVISHGRIRRGRLFFLRGLKGRSARLDSELFSSAEANAPGAADEVVAEAAEGEAAPVEAKAEKKKPKAEKAPAKS